MQEPIRISPILPVGLAIVATGFTAFAFVIGEQVLGPLFTATTSRMNEQGQQVAGGLRMEWLAIPVLITILLWIWVALVVTKRQAVTTPGSWSFIKLPQRSLKRNVNGMVQVIMVFFLTLVIGGLFWIVFTYPYSATIASGMTFRSDATNTILFFNLMIGGIPIIVGLVGLAWSFTRTIEERETGISSL